jgi:ribosomal protein L11 methyltransferase
MKWIEARVFFESDEPSWAMEIISDIFNELHTKGVVIEDPLSDPHEGWGIEAHKPGDYYAVTGYFPENHQTENKRRLLEEKLFQLNGQYNLRTRVVYQGIDEQDWANSWKKYFKPQKIGDRIVVKPTWHDYSPEPDEIILEIDPGMAFGTGTHPTTAMCVRMLEKYIKSGDFFLDVGTGSGILMLVAHRFGAARLLGTDRDEMAVTVACQNLLRNNVPSGKFNLIVADLIEGIRGKFHVVTANILSEVIVVLLDNLSEVLCPGGLFIASGIIEENKDMVLKKMAEQGLGVLDTDIREQWVVIVARKDNSESIHFPD